jgi:hypothetical protein
MIGTKNPAYILMTEQKELFAQQGNLKIKYSIGKNVFSWENVLF